MKTFAECSSLTNVYNQQSTCFKQIFISEDYQTTIYFRILTATEGNLELMHTEACENDKARADSLSFLVLSDLRLHVLHYITLISHPFEFWKSR